MFEIATKINDVLYVCIHSIQTCVHMFRITQHTIKFPGIPLRCMTCGTPPGRRCKDPRDPHSTRPWRLETLNQAMAVIADAGFHVVVASQNVQAIHKYNI